MIFLPRVKADRVEHDVTVDMSSVDVGSDHTLILTEGSLCKLTGDLMSLLRRDIISFREALHQMIVLPSVGLVIELFGQTHFFVSCLRRTVISV